MPLPTSYTESDLAVFMHIVTETAAAALGWTALTFDAEPVNDALILYGVSDIAQATDIPKLRAAARVAAWRAIVQATAGMHGFSADGQSMPLEQVQAMALRALSLAESDAATYGVNPAFTVRIDRVVDVHDPYAYVPDDSRVIP
jgi:hypothetical protein